MGLWNRSRDGSPIVSAEPDTHENRRSAERKRQRLIDAFVSANGMSRRPCTLRDMSETGSRIELWDDYAKPLRPGDILTLIIPSDGVEVVAEVRWRKADVMGLLFTSERRDISEEYE